VLIIVLKFIITFSYFIYIVLKLKNKYSFFFFFFIFNPLCRRTIRQYVEQVLCLCTVLVFPPPLYFVHIYTVKSYPHTLSIKILLYTVKILQFVRLLLKVNLAYMYIISLCCISHLFPPTVSPFEKFIKIIDSHLIDYFRYKNMHVTTNSKKLSSHQLKGKIHFITVHIIRIKPFIDTVKKSSKKNI